MPGGNFEGLPLGHNSDPHKSISSVEEVEEGYRKARRMITNSLDRAGSAS